MSQHLMLRRFQTLPMLVIMHISKLVVRPKDKYNLNERIDDDELKLLVVLGQLCKSWRNVAQSIIHRVYAETTLCKPGLVIKRDKLITRSIFDGSRIGYVRHLLFGFYNNDLFTDNQALFLDNQQYVNACFHAARTVMIQCFQGDGIPNVCEASEAAALHSAARICELVPNAHTISFVVNFGEVHRYSPNLWNIVNQFISYISSGKQKMHLFISSTYHLPTEPAFVPGNITDLHIGWNEGSGDAITLMYTNAKTLRNLKIGGAKTNDFYSLLINNDGQNVTYSNLLSLIILPKEQRYVAIENRPVFDNAVPFPKLEKLGIQMLYPFGDSVVFRGNTETLRNISIRTDKETLAMLNKTGTFACGRFTALRTVKLLSYMDIIEGTNELAQETIKIYESIHGTVEHLQVMFSEASKRLLSRVQQGLTFDSLRQLDICEAHLSLRDIVRALKVLPALQRLRSRQAPVPTFIVLAQSAERVANFCQKHMRISASFQQWDIYYGAASPATSYSSVYAAFLSVICPHFTCLCVQYKCREKHYTNIARLQKTTFSAFAEDLQKLLVSYKPT